ncbi:unnamed protein product, partial [Nesidiocoris tenuis]
MEVFCVILCVITAGAHPIMSAFGPAWFALPITIKPYIKQYGSTRNNILTSIIRIRVFRETASFAELSKTYIFFFRAYNNQKSQSTIWQPCERRSEQKKDNFTNPRNSPARPYWTPVLIGIFQGSARMLSGLNVGKTSSPKTRVVAISLSRHGFILAPGKTAKYESVIQKFRKSFSLRFYKKGGSSSSKDGEEDEPPPVPPDSDLAEVEAGTAASEPEPESPSETPSPQPSTDSPAPTQPKELDNSSQEKF